jgi:aspartate kinase
MHVDIFKFGGGTVNSAEGVRNISRILKLYPGKPVMIVISAMGKTTNALEQCLRLHMEGDAAGVSETFYRLKDFHLDIAHELFADKSHPVFREMEEHFESLRTVLKDIPNAGYDELYGRIVGVGELISATLVSQFLTFEGYPVRPFDARSMIITDENFRDGKVDWKKTQLAIQKYLFPWFQGGKGRLGMTQGFIGRSVSGKPTTLGREGSDYTAAIIAYCLRAREVTIWKDVPGVMNADPKWFENPVKLDTLSYHEAVELAYYGATVIHPKTVKPLENARIILHVKSVLRPGDEGSRILALNDWTIDTPLYIRKQNQVLISLSPRDFSFIVEENLSQLFSILADMHIKVNVMQNSAISFSFCIDHDPVTIGPLIPELQKTYEVRYNEEVELFTIRHYSDESIRRITSGRQVLLEQKTRHTVHLALL